MTAFEARKAVWEKDSNSITKELYNQFQNKIQEAISLGYYCCTVKVPTTNSILKIQSVLNLLKAEGFIVTLFPNTVRFIQLMIFVK